MIVVEDVAGLRAAIRAARQAGQRIGCVPTMGALHAGHVSLVDECRKHADFVVVTIFVNPTQFGPHEDLSRYPRPIDADLEACRQAGASLVFMPQVLSLYPPDFETWVTTDQLSSTLEGAHRPGHFRGVTTIVAKLFNIVQPDVACFGAKDYQQQSLIRRMVRDLDFPIEIIVCPTVREADGLAMSSRNVYLSRTERESALSLSQSLDLARQLLLEGEQDVARVQSEMHAFMSTLADVVPDYAVIADPDSLQPLATPQPRMVALVAARVGKTRLIDNLEIELPGPQQ